MKTIEELKQERDEACQAVSDWVYAVKPRLPFSMAPDWKRYVQAEDAVAAALAEQRATQPAEPSGETVPGKEG